MQDNLKIHGGIISHSLEVLRSRVPCEEQHVIDYIQDKFKEVLAFAPTLDYKDVPVNGTRSVVKMLANWTLFVAEEKRSQKEIIKFIPILHMMSCWCDLFATFSEILNDKEMGCEESREECKQLMLRLLESFDPRAFKAVHGEGYFLRCFPSSSFALTHFYKLLLLHVNRGTSEVLPGLLRMSRRAVVSRLSKKWPRMIGLNFTVEFFRIFDLSYIIAANKVNQVFFSAMKPKVRVKKYVVDVKRKYNIAVDVEGVRLEVLPKAVDKQIKFAILKDKSSKKYSDKLLVYIHGGGFCGPHYSRFHNLYMKSFCNMLPGLTVLTVSYSFAPEKRFPHGLLDVLDSYLWLTSSDTKVQEILGFTPRDIVIAGDSSGGNFCLSLTVLLNELKFLDTAFKPVFPSTMILLYPAVTVDDTPYPSGIMSSMDIVLGFYVFNSVGRAYLPITMCDANGNWNVLENNMKVPDDWHSRQEYNFLRSPFLSPVYYDKLQDLSHINLAVMGCEFDPLLDESVQVAKVWKGPVDFYLAEESLHACLVMHNVSASAKKALNIFANMTRKAF